MSSLLVQHVVHMYVVTTCRYRLVPGDVCDWERPNSVNRDTHPKHTPTDHLCDEGDAETYLDMETVKLVSEVIYFYSTCY